MRTEPGSNATARAPALGAVGGRSLRRLTLLLFALFCAAYAVFAQDPASFNTLCRAATTANIVQHGRIDIDGYAGFTQDLAARDGVYYCDKAPGMSFLAVPAAWAFTRALPISPETTYSGVWNAFLYVCSLATSALLTASAATVLFRYLFWRVGDLGAALLASLAFGLGSPVWGWATSFFSHAGAAALLVLGFVALDLMTRRLVEGGRPLLLALAGGLAFGTATAVEYHAVVAAALVGAAFLAVSPWARATTVVQTYAVAAAGGLLALAPVLAYHAAAFGSPFATGYRFAAVYTGTHAGLFGIGAPRLDVLATLLLGAQHGMLWHAPMTIASLWAAVRLARAPGLRLPGVVVLLVMAWYLLMNAGFEYWHGGATTGPRYLTPAIGFTALALGLAWPLLKIWERRAAWGLVAVSGAVAFASTAVDMTAGALWPSVLPDFFRGDLRQALTYRFIEQASVLHFIPPLLVGGVFAWLIAREMRRLRSGAAA